ncbi:hypothetical protein KAR91_61385 [Candidatus Pacearchaeota archaeon]|nr:hypothetical protein [Candidatus Pacearchaeota archaeon]
MINVTKEDLRNNSFVRAVIRIANSNFMANIIVGIMIWVIALIPTWLYFIVRAVVQPGTFWQEFALFGIFAILIGWVQIIFIIFGAACTVVILLEGL